VEPGIVLDERRAVTRPFGLACGPDPSTCREQIGSPIVARCTWPTCSRCALPAVRPETVQARERVPRAVARR
jgi:hypothetical protein